MLDYSRALFSKTKKEVELAYSLYNFGTQIIYIAYLIFMLCVPNPIWYLHLALLIISASFLVFDVVTTNEIKSIQNEKFSLFGILDRRRRLKEAKDLKRGVAKLKFYSSHAIKLIVLATAFYPIFTAPETVGVFSIMSATVMAMLWIVQILFEIFKAILKGRLDLIMEAVKADAEFVTKPINTVKNTVKRFLGKEVEEEPAPSKNREHLDNLVAAKREEKQAQQATVKAEFTEKVSSWLDRQISKIPFMQKNDASNQLDKSNAIEVEEYEEEV